MSLTSGTKLGPYEIQSPLGAGGMGEVYRARDSRLDRIVAVKILPSHLAEDQQARQRFEREARTISSLNHPNICVLHDVGTQDGTAYLVMEYVQGESLHSRLRRGPLPSKQVLELAMQICDALDRAHRAGIVHRDLKPGNIMVTESGAKLLDFGLAKSSAGLAAFAGENPGHLTPSTPTVNLSSLRAPAAALTQQGTIVGTFQYMAPEVLQGSESDARSDIFSFGCVLYEMVTGRKAFEGKSQLSVLSAILEKEPEPITNVQPASPPALDYLITTCLAKNPSDRFQTAHDLKLQLAWIAKSGSQSGIPAINIRRSKTKLWLAGIAALCLVAIALATVALIGRQPRRILRAAILPPDGTQFETLYRNGPPVLSPDGTRVAFVAQQDGRNTIRVRSLDKLEAITLPGTEDAFYPFWSPDGTAVAFFMHGKLWRMDVNAGSPTAICDTPEPRGGSWSRTDTIIFAPFIAGPIMQVPVSGGIPKPVTKVPVAAANASDRWPFFLPDGRHFLFLHTPTGAADDHNEIRFASVDGGQERSLLQGRYFTSAYASGWLLTGHDGSLQAWKFDPSNGKLQSEPIQLVDKVTSDEITASSVFSVSAQGELLYQQGKGGSGDRHIWVDESGKQLSQVSEPSIYGPSRLSPDGSRIATGVVNKSGAGPVWVWDLKGGTRAPLSSDSDYADAIVWSANASVLYFDIFDSANRKRMRVVPADGSQQEKVLFESENDTLPVDVTSDGKWLLYEEWNRSKGPDTALNAFPLVSGLQVFTVVEQVARNSNARLKPSANDWLAYESDQSGRSEIYLTRFPRPGAKYQVSQTGGSQPVWSKDGKKLFYLDPLRKMVAVEIQTTGDSIQIGNSKTLFQTGIRHSISTEGYDVSRDGKFLIVNSITESTAPVVLVTNWDAELKK
jgi:serine/threonine protein kinase/Tol biopolymer transport system component